MPQRFRETDEGSFFGSLIYDRIVSANHFLRQLKGMVDWQPVTRQLLEYYKGGAEYGAPPYDPCLLLRMLFVSFLFNLSERQTEEFVKYHLPAKFFVGLAVDESAPDHSTLAVFKRRMVEKDEGKAFRFLFDEVVKLAQERGVKFGEIQILDSVHTVANVNVEKDDSRAGKGKGRRDKDAEWGAKGKKKVKAKDKQSGKLEEKKETEYFYGYKMHVSLNAEAGLVTAVTFTGGSAYDGHELPKLVEQDLKGGVEAEIYTGDRGYDDGENHEYLEGMGKKSAIKLNDYRTEKKDGNKAKWVKMKADPDYKRGLKERYRVEQKFGEGKEEHGLRRCRFLGLVRYRIQGYMTLLVLNLKRLVKMGYGAIEGLQKAGTATA
jgi:transposase, IS5 family